jgi:hypothetical protein
MSSQNLGKEQGRKLRLYYRLILSYPDFKHAFRCAERLADVERICSAHCNGDDLLERALYSSMIVSYARPFNSQGNSRIGRIPPLCNEITSFLTPDEIELHKYVLVCRNKLVAHSDAEAIDLDPFVAVDLPNNFVVPEKNDALAPFTLEYVVKFMDVSKKAWQWSIEERHRLEKDVVPFLSRRVFSMQTL